MPSGIWMISKVLIINELYNVGINCIDCNFNKIRGSHYEDCNEYGGKIKCEHFNKSHKFKVA